ncbi:hypothetical protein D9758_000145 [Tetrapyrgos nigripes]|uniref:LIM zinc-binding domain-containing protein n=1 Tax=Tetrapyrgos nigripes TaxID=182062 RepID=A0A8H5H150_9AGAR|nr:hypothetical protein D9758_000145 [Tetrapyrgos nigripes]
MGFCRRCGDIVTGERCKCGGTAVAPVVSWKESMNANSVQDRWSKTYVSRDPSPTRTSPTKRFPQPLNSSSSTNGAPLSNRVSAHIANTTSRLTNRPPSPLKNSVVAPEVGILPSLTSHPTGSLAKVYGSVLQSAETLNSHACSSCHTVFQPDSTLYPGQADSDEPQFLCRNCFVETCSKGPCPTCSRPVLPLKSEGPFIDGGDGHFYHKACYKCVGCGKNIGASPMVDLLGRPSCASCFDTCLQRDRTPKSTPKKIRASTSTSNSPNVGGYGSPSRESKGGRESSPAVVEELEQRLGISKSRESSPELEELSHRLSMIGRDSMNGSPRLSRYSGMSSAGNSPALRSSNGSPSPKRLSQRLDRSVGPEGREHASRPSSGLANRSRPTTPSPAPTEEQIEEMKRRFMKSTSSPQTESPSLPPPTRRRLRSTRSSGSLSQLPTFPSSPPDTPDLTSDFSDTTTQSLSDPDSPPRNSLPNDDISPFKYYSALGSRYSRSNMLINDTDDVIIEETNSQLTTPTRTPNKKTDDAGKSTQSKPKITPTPEKRSQPLRVQPELSSCAKCRKVLFSVREGGQYVTVPDGEGGSLRSYHKKCFTCVICDNAFQESKEGQAMFVKSEKGPCHLQCAPPSKISVKTIHPNDPLPPIRPRTSSTTTPSLTASTSSNTNAAYVSSSRYNRPPSTAPISSSIPRFGSSSACPGCGKSVSPMERGVVPGPQGTRWHQTCLVCGGKRPPSTLFYKPREEKKNEPGCGKKLDSAAKADGEGNVYCRECWLMIRDTPQTSSPVRSSPLLPNYTGGKIAPQNTGTTIARQFTGLGGDPLVRQITGGGLCPTRSISPTKQLGMVAPGTIRPRPKSVIGMRHAKSVDEGRGMFLVRQMTGNGGN